MKKILLSLAAFLMICCTVCAQKEEKQTTNELSSKTLVAYFSVHIPEHTRSLSGSL